MTARVRACVCVCVCVVSARFYLFAPNELDCIVLPLMPLTRMFVLLRVRVDPPWVSVHFGGPVFFLH